jgi:hypothetical protein
MYTLTGYMRILSKRKLNHNQLNDLKMKISKENNFNEQVTLQVEGGNSSLVTWQHRLLN